MYPCNASSRAVGAAKKLVVGGHLRRLLAVVYTETLAEAVAVRYLCDIARVLAHLHLHGVLYLDVSHAMRSCRLECGWGDVSVGEAERLWDEQGRRVQPEL